MLLYSTIYHDEEEKVIYIYIYIFLIYPYFRLLLPHFLTIMVNKVVYFFTYKFKHLRHPILTLSIKEEIFKPYQAFYFIRNSFKKGLNGTDVYNEIISNAVSET